MPTWFDRLTMRIIFLILSLSKDALDDRTAV
jgi:hypothetical protein